MPSYRPVIFPTASFYVRQRASHSIHSHGCQPRRSVLEVERKFAPSATSIRQLDRNGGDPPFESIVHKGVTCFEDTYYDTPKDTLSKAGVWLRRREKFESGVRDLTGLKREGPHNASWEAKVRVGGDYINSAFREMTDVQEISAMLGVLVPGLELDAHGFQIGLQELLRLITDIQEIAAMLSDLFPQEMARFIADAQEISAMLGALGPGSELNAHGLQGRILREMARFTTCRKGYVVDGKFTVVIDATDFGHTVGEVELERAFTESSCEGEDKTRAIVAMDKEIDGFMGRFLWAFPVGKPVGKLSAYFGHKTDQSTAG